MPDASASAGLDRFVEPDRVFFLSSQHEDIIGYAIRLGFVGDKATVTAVVKTDSSSPDGHVLFKMLVKGMEEQQFTLQEAFNTAVSSLACSFAMFPLLLFALVSSFCSCPSCRA